MKLLCPVRDHFTAVYDHCRRRRVRFFAQMRLVIGRLTTIAATVMCVCCLLLVFTGGERSIHRIGQWWSITCKFSWHASDRLLQESTSAAPVPPQQERPLEYSPFVKGSITRVTWHIPRANRTAGKDCRTEITSLVVGSDELYYILHQYCQVDGTLEDRALSIRRMNLSQMQDGDGSRPQGENDSLISHMWPYGQPNGTKVREPSDFGGAHVTGMGLSKDGMHLVLSVTNEDPVVIRDSGTRSLDDNGSVFTSLSLADGSRSSSPPLSKLSQAWAFEPNKSFLYYLQLDSALVNVTVNDVGLPNGDPNPISAWNVELQSDPIDPNEEFQSGSLLSDGSCLYSVTSTDWLFGWRIQPGHLYHNTISPPAHFLHRRAIDVVATSQGCHHHVFTAAHDTVAVFELSRTTETACGWMSARSALPRYFGEADVTALALGDNGDGLSLYVGTSDASVYSVPLDRSEVSRCEEEPYSVWQSDGVSEHSSTINLPYFALEYFPVSLLSSALAGVIYLVLVIVPSFWDSGLQPPLPYYLIILLTSIFVVVAIATGAFVWVRLLRKRRRRALEQVNHNSAVADRPRTSAPPDCTAVDFWGLRPTRVQQFGIKTLSDCTENFSSTHQVGNRGAFGKVYNGSLDGKDVAIKVMAGELTDTKRNQFVAEVNTLSAINHVNLIQLIGYCQEGSQCILVYPYFPGGCLHERLFPNTDKQWRIELDSPPPLTLQERMSIAFQIARGLQYLHDDAKPPIIHRDIKSSNVLLSDGCGDTLHVVVADFGLAAIGERVLDTGHDHVVITSHIGGTFGYMSPEYMLRGELSEKNDVYSFGVLVLELLTGRKVAARAPSGVGWQTLVEWVKPFLRDQGEKAQDPSLDMPRAILDQCLWDQMVGDSMKQMVMNTCRLAWECVHEEYGSRPAMRAVVQRIHSMLLDVGWDFLIRTMDMEHLLTTPEAEDNICKIDDAESQGGHEVHLE
ncbi:hypothetical protein CBR_g1130 [Chara braunii]|uniref:Protein kinase domain-containing protein n=1 Tax=Chara braunii TaxID=69332 RepID=A0A388KD79_CHABU|nr:hypothetical protein CBR_g1130 [Chara braunii]|eukprot:GBG68010.1 hypothetical protein CBR_g1130 [Chara braunii]